MQSLLHLVRKGHMHPDVASGTANAIFRSVAPEHDASIYAAQGSTPKEGPRKGAGGPHEGDDDTAGAAKVPEHGAAGSISKEGPRKGVGKTQQGDGDTAAKAPPPGTKDANHA